MDGAESVIGLNWLDSNLLRAYPLSEVATGLDTTATFRIPDSFLAGFYLAIDASLAVDTTKFYVSGIVATSAGYAVSFSYDDSGTPVLVGTATVPAAGFAMFAEFPVAPAPAGAFAALSGRVVIGRLDEIAAQPAGSYTFAPAGGYLDPDTLRPQIRGVTAIVVVNGADVSPPLYGVIELAAGANTQITVSGGTIRIDAVEGAGLTEACACDATSGAALSPPIRTINGIPPDAFGNFLLLGDACVGLKPQEHGLALSNACGSPCCGCAELQSLVDQIAHMATQAAMLEDLALRLRSTSQDFANVVLGSRVNDTVVPCP
jgi:hypothetical protein